MEETSVNRGSANAEPVDTGVPGGSAGAGADGSAKAGSREKTAGGSDHALPDRVANATAALAAGAGQSQRKPTAEAAPAMNPFGKSDTSLRQRILLPLRPTIIAVCMAMTVPVLLLIVQLNYSASEQAARTQAGALVERFRTDAIDDIVGKFAALRSLIEPAAELGRQETSFYEDDRALGYLRQILTHSDTILNVYVGLEDGSFRQARRLHDMTVPIHGTLPPEGAVFAYRLLEPVPGEPTLDRYIFLDTDGNPLSEVAAESGYDPRKRAWYMEAVEAGGTTITDPELFWAFGLVGFTVAAPYAVDGTLRGVVAADVTLDNFSAYLAQNPISKGSYSYLLDDRGQVLAASDKVTRYGSHNDDVELVHVSDVSNRTVARAYGERPLDGFGGDGPGVYRYTDAAGEEFIVSLSGFGDSLGKPWQMMVVTPVSDFTSEFDEKAEQLHLIGIAAIVLQLVVVAVIASLISAPLKRLAYKVERIQALTPSNTPPVRSRVREIAFLSHAIETLDVAVQTFARFVPVSLVRQLLQSEQRLDLGGHSRFLTIFFSDIEGFSTIAERIASRDLMLRISSVLGIVSRSVHAEQGTIDKFIGDGVMAFWGAPAALEDHAYHACVAALRIHKTLDELNAQWLDADEPQMRIRIGIHSDAVLVGNVGTEERMSYTVLGDGVNLTARLEALNKAYGTPTLISHDTFREAGDRLCVRPVDEVVVKGRRARVTVYELLGAYGAEDALAPTPEQEALARQTRAAFDALITNDHALAKELFEAILQTYPDDRVVRLQLDRLAAAVADVPETA